VVFVMVWAAPPTSGGLTVLQTLAMLEHWDLGQYANAPVTRYNLILQALQLAFADRNKYLGDPEFVDIPFEGWLDPDYIEDRADLLEPDLVDCTKITAGVVPGATSAAQSVSEAAFAGETTHLTVVDRWGNIVAFTTTIEQVFGTGRMLPGYGFMINNELTDFDARPGGPNEVQPFKRPLSSIAPSIVFDDGVPILTLGSPGGPRIIGSVVQVLINILDLGLDLQTAVALPRLFSSSCTAAPNVRWDAGFPDAVRAALSAQPFNYKFEPTPQEVGNVNLISIGDEAYTGVADPRREGVAIGLTDKAGKPDKNM
jgi:gamma-glutamyltranspeptidase/glutathione hydrolase